MSRRLERLTLVVATFVLTALSFFHAMSLQTEDSHRLTMAQSPMMEIQAMHMRKNEADATQPNVTKNAVRVHSKQSSNKPPILFVHFHKSGGTSVCESMRLFQNQVNITNALGERSDEYLVELNNCNTEFAHPHLIDRDFSSVQNCRMLEPYTMDDSGASFRRNNFLAVEIPLHERMPCPRFRSFAIMRDPVKRCLSHLLFEKIEERKVEKWMKEKTPGRRKDFFMNGWPIINNMVIRQLLGRARFIHPHPINEDDLEQAKKQLDKFDAFVPLEYLKDEKVLTLLNKTVPEYYQGLIKNNRIPANQQPATYLSYSSDVIARITEENKYDILLYKYMLDKLGILSTQHNEVSMNASVKS